MKRLRSLSPGRKQINSVSSGLLLRPPPNPRGAQRLERSRSHLRFQQSMDNLKMSILIKNQIEEKHVRQQVEENKYSVSVEISENWGHPDLIECDGIVILDRNHHQMEILSAKMCGTNEDIPEFMNRTEANWKHPWPLSTLSKCIEMEFTCHGGDPPAMVRVWPSKNKLANILNGSY